MVFFSIGNNFFCKHLSWLVCIFTSPSKENGGTKQKLSQDTLRNYLVYILKEPVFCYVYIYCFRALELLGTISGLSYTFKAIRGQYKLVHLSTSKVFYSSSLITGF